MKGKSKYSILSLLALTLAFTGCSSGADKEQEAQKTPEPVNSGAAGTQAPSKAVWFSTVDFWNPPANWSTDPNTVQGKITEKTGLTFEFNIPAQDGETKLNLMLVSSGDSFPDLLTLTNAVLGKKLKDSGKVWDIEEFLKKYDPESHILKDFPADMKAAIIDRDGSFFAFPSNVNSPDARKVYPPSPFQQTNLDYAANNGIMVNSKLLKEAGLTLEDIKTEKGLLAAYEKVKALKVDGASVIPLLVDGKSYQDTSLSFLQDTFGAMALDKDGNYRDRLLAPETKLALNFLRKAYQNNYLDPGQMTVDNAAVKTDVASGRVFTFMGNMANTSFQLNDYWTSSGVILSDAGTKPAFAKNYLAGSGWMLTYISKTAKEPEKLAKFLSFMSSKEGLLLHQFGFEGVDYKWNAEGFLEKTEQGLKNASDYMKTGVSAFWPFTNTALTGSIVQPPTEKTDIQSITGQRVFTAFGKSPEVVRYDDSSIRLPGDLFAKDAKLTNAELQIKTYKQAQIAKIILAKDDAQFNQLYDEMIAQLKKLGIEELDKVRNDWVQEKNKKYGIHVKGINS
ncbi:extracellular solute-binding protein [Paenibacillus sp. YN15]|uniref:extracellular solute-binding protein n=1 Tax=Paenibacillus sp. YN15 TaxID=1742774 RepID=UPI000DCC5E5F|nr:extracellular solute-binding protein [Paenibacillus sp. YN15]RAV05073.1 hypothetical protein DQG13_04120 [Paenibacillus sp. YN15]